VAKDGKNVTSIGSFVELESINAEFACPVRFVNKENLHLTWKFFGDTDPDRVLGILDNVEKITSKIKEISINFNRFEIWPNAKFPRLLVLAGDDTNGEATKLYNAFNPGKFKPHITIARFKTRQRLKSPVIMPERLIFKEKTINFKEIVLLSSTLSPKGSIYEKIKTFTITAHP